MDKNSKFKTVILGLSFLLKDNGHITLNKDFFTMSRHCITSPLEKKIGKEITKKRRKELEKQNKYSRKMKKKKEVCECKNEEQCNLLNIDLEEIDEYRNRILIEESQLVQIDNSINYLLANITKEDITYLINKLEKLEIIGENILKYWKKDRIYYKLKIKNPDYKIKAAKIEDTKKEKEDYKMHITELLKLRVIRISYSPHRSAAFLVNKHSK